MLYSINQKDDVNVDAQEEHVMVASFKARL
jgi:hypothetical protein